MKHCSLLYKTVHIIVLLSLLLNLVSPAVAASVAPPAAATNSFSLETTLQKPILAFLHTLRSALTDSTRANKIISTSEGSASSSPVPETEPSTEARGGPDSRVEAITGSVITDTIYLPFIVHNGDNNPSPNPGNEVLITPETGGSLASVDGTVRVDVPANAVSMPVYLRYVPENQAMALSTVTVRQQFSLEARQVTDSTPIETFNLPIQISMHVASVNFNVEENEERWTLAVWRSTGNWQPLPTTHDPILQTVSAQTVDTSTFALINNINAAAAVQLAPFIDEKPSTPTLPFPFYTEIITYFHAATETVWLSSTPDGSGPIWTDDQVTITVFPSGSTYMENHSILGPGITQLPPEDITALFVPGVNTVTIELTDLIPPRYSTGGYYLVGIDGSLGDIIRPTIFNVDRWLDGRGNVVIRAQVTDNVGVSNVILLFNGTPVTMSSIGGGFYEAVVPDAGHQFNDFQIVAIDTSGNLGFFPNASSLGFAGYTSRKLGWNVCHNKTCGSCGCIGDPVATGTGNFSYQVADLIIPGIGDTEIKLERGYNSLPNEPLGVIRYIEDGSSIREEPVTVHPEPFGPGWTFPLATSLIVLNNTWFKGVQVRYADGHTAEFRDIGGGTFEAIEPRVYDQLTGDGSGYILTRKNRTEYHFDPEGRLTEMVDRNGNRLTLTYDGDGRLIQVENSAGHWLNFEYNNGNDLITDIYASLNRHLHYEYEAGRLVSVTDPNGNPTTYEYNSDGRLTDIKLPDEKPAVSMEYEPERGRVTSQTLGATAQYTFLYDDANLTTTVTDLLDQTTTHIYDANYRLIEVRDALENFEYFDYDDDENRTFYQDRNGNSWNYIYDERGNLLERRDPVESCGDDPPAEDLTRWKYDEFNQVISMTNTLDHTWLYDYDATGDLVQITDPNEFITSLAYDDRGLPTVITDTLSRVTRYAYDTFGNLERTVDPDGFLSLSSYDLAGYQISFTDANDHTVYFAYDKNSNLIRVADPKQQVSTFEYDATNLLINSQDRRRVVSRYQYNEYLQRTAEQDFPDGQWQHYDYDALYRQESVTGRLGYITRYGYDEVNRLETVTDPLGAITRYGYDPNGNVTKIVDKLNAATEIEYDAVNRVKVLTDAAGYKTQYCYDVEDRLVQVTDPRGGITRYRYDKLDRLVEITDPLDAITRYEYDAEGNRTAVIDAAGRRTDYTYDDLNRLASIAQPELPGSLRPTTHFTYDPVGNIITITSPRGFVTTFTYDENDNLATITDPLDGRVSYTYDAGDNPLTVTDPNGHITATTYDPVGLPLRIEDPLGHATRFEYDAAYNLVKVINAQDRPTLYDYDPLQRLIRQTDPLGHMTLYKRDARGQVTAMADANGWATRYSYDVLGRLVTVTDALAGLTHYEYDPAGNLVATTDVKDQVTRFAYNLRNQLIKEVNPLDNTWHYAYDAVGNLVRRVDAEEQATLYHYDSNDRLIKIDYPDDAVLFAYDLDGNETQMCDWLDCTSHTYDQLDRPTATTDWLGQTIGRSYDPASNLTSLTYPNGYQVSYSYDANDWLTDVTDPHGDVSTYDHNPLGQVTHLLHPNRTIASFTYDQANRLTSVDNRQMLATQPQSAYAYALDKVGNRTQVIETRAAFDGSADPIVLTHNYAYDPLNRLTNATTDTPVSDTTYSFDAVGNRLTKEGTVLTPDPDIPKLPVAPRPEAASAIYNAANQLTSISDPDSTTNLEYDRKGNRIREVEVITAEDKTVVTEYRYDVENRLVGATKSTAGAVTMEATYTYDGYGRRVRKQVIYPNGSQAGQTLTYLYDGLEIIGVQLEEKGDIEETYFYLAPSPITGLSRPFAMEQLSSGKQYWYQTDGLDSIVALTDQDGKLVSPFLYDEYGQILAGDTDLQIFTFTAQDYDPETGLYHFFARYYDPARGVWLAQDVYRGQIQDLRSLHRYMYNAASPVNYVDLYGYYFGEEWTNAFFTSSRLKKEMDANEAATGFRVTNAELAEINSLEQQIAQNKYQATSVKVINQKLATGDCSNLDWYYQNLSKSYLLENVYQGQYYQALAQQEIDRIYDEFSRQYAPPIIAAIAAVPLSLAAAGYILPYASAAGWEVTVGTMQLSYPVASFIGNTFTIGTTAAFSAGSSIAASGYVCSVLSSDSRETCGTIGGIGLTTALVSQALISSVPVPGGDKLRRPYLRKSTIEAIEANARIHKGKFIDPNTGQVINGPYQIGHKPGYEWKHWEKWAYKNNISQAELNEILNNPKYYLIELPINNMSHKFESDVFLGP